MSIRGTFGENHELLEEASLQASGVARYLVKNIETGRTYRSSSIYVQPNDREIHIAESTLENGRFPNNARLYQFIRDNEQGTRHGAGNSAYAFVLHVRHIPGMIRILRSQRYEDLISQLAATTEHLLTTSCHEATQAVRGTSLDDTIQAAADGKCRRCASVTPMLSNDIPGRQS